MKIAQLASVWERIPPTTYGGAELITSYITEGLLKRGHKVTLFATGNSITKAKLVSIFPKGLYRANIPWSNSTYPFLNTLEAFKRAKEFDIIHNHAGIPGLFFTNFVKTPTISTLHSSSTVKDKLIRKKFPDALYVAISRFQAKAFNLPKNTPVIYNGIRLKDYPFSTKKREYLIWLGRISKEKGTKEAIEIAKKSGEKLIIAGKVDKFDPPQLEYYQKEIAHLIDNYQIKYLGEVSNRKIPSYLSKAKAILVPLNWDEPFGLTMIEAMACGTPVIAFRKAAVSEIVIQGKTGFILPHGDIQGMVKAVKKIGQINPKACREQVEKNFTVEEMVDKYEKLFKTIIKKRIKSNSY